MLLKEETNRLVLEGLLCVAHTGVFGLTLTEQAPTQISQVDSLVGIMMCMVLHLQWGFHSPHASILRDSWVVLVFKLESQISVQLQMHHWTSMAELLLQALGSLPFCGKWTAQWLGWSLVIPVFFRHLCLVSRVGQRCFTKICRFCLLLTQGCPVWSDSAGCWEKGQLVGGSYL